VASAFELIGFGARITSLDGRGGRTERNRSIVEVGELNIAHNSKCRCRAATAEAIVAGQGDQVS
jgi:hypothetical protein